MELCVKITVPTKGESVTYSSTTASVLYFDASNFKSSTSQTKEGMMPYNIDSSRL